MDGAGAGAGGAGGAGDGDDGGAATYVHGGYVSAQQFVNELEDPEQVIAWFRKELKRKHIGASRLLSLMDNDRSGSATMNEFCSGLQSFNFDLDRRTYMRLFKAIDVSNVRGVRCISPQRDVWVARARAHRKCVFPVLVVGASVGPQNARSLKRVRWACTPALRFGGAGSPGCWPPPTLSSHPRHSPRFRAASSAWSKGKLLDAFGARPRERIQCRVRVSSSTPLRNAIVYPHLRSYAPPPPLASLALLAPHSLAQDRSISLLELKAKLYPEGSPRAATKRRPRRERPKPVPASLEPSPAPPSPPPPVAVATEAEFDDRWARHTLQRLCEILTGFHRDQLSQSMSQKRMPLSRYLQTVVFSQWKFWVAEEAHREKVRALTIWHLLHRRYQVNSKMIQGKVIKDWQNMTNFARIAEAQEALQEMWSMDQRLDGMFKGLMLDAREILHADRSTLFLVDAEENVLLSKIALGTGEPIQVAIGQGIVGSVARSGQMLNITNAREDARFNSAIDKMTGYTTRSILCAPVISEGVIIGVLQVINKLGGTFTKHDEVMIEAFCAHIGTTALLVDCESDFSKILSSLDTWRRDYLLVRGQHKHLAKLMTWIETRHMRGTMRRALHKMRRTCTWLAAEARAGEAREMEGNAHLKLSDMAHGLRKNHTVCLSSALARWRGNMEMSDVLEQFQGIEATLRLQTLGRNLGKARSLCLARALRRWGLHCEADRAEERLEKLVHSSQTVADLRRQLAEAEKAIEGVRRRDAELAAAADHELETLEGALRRERDLVSTAEEDRAHDREALEAARKRERELVAAAENDREALEAARKRERELVGAAEDDGREALEAARKREREIAAAAEDDREALEAAARKRERDLTSAAEDDQEALEAARKRERELVAAAEDDRDALEAARRRERELVRAAEDGRQALEAARKRERELVAAAEDDREALEVARKRERELVGAAEGTHGELEKARRREAELVAAEENRGPEGASLEEVRTSALMC